MMEELESGRKKPIITFSPMKTDTTHVNEEREKVSPFLVCRARLLEKILE